MKINMNFLKKNNRIDIIYSGIFTKIVGLVSVFFLTYVLIPSNYGQLTYVLSLINVVTPFLGLGLNQSLLRYGDVKSIDRLNKLTSFTLYKGIMFTIFTMGLLLLSVFVLNNDDKAIIYITLILSFQLIFSYPLKILQSRLRLKKENKAYSKTVFITSICLVCLLVLGYYCLGFNGVLFAYMLYPLAALLISLKNDYSIFNYKKLDKSFNKKDLYRYGFSIGLAGVASQMLYSMDIIMIQNIVNNPESVAIYRVASLLSINGLIFCNHLMSADFVYIKELNQAQLSDYTKKLTSKLFLFSILFTIISIPFMFIATNGILNELYSKSFFVHLILMVGFILSFTIRIPIGTILSARGFANYNALNAYISLAINVVLNFIFIYYLDYLGAALATVLTMLISTIISINLFKKMQSKTVN